MQQPRMAELDCSRTWLSPVFKLQDRTKVKEKRNKMQSQLDRPQGQARRAGARTREVKVGTVLPAEKQANLINARSGTTVPRLTWPPLCLRMISDDSTVPGGPRVNEFFSTQRRRAATPAPLGRAEKSRLGCNDSQRSLPSECIVRSSAFGFPPLGAPPVR
jgi:hypothetical protein